MPSDALTTLPPRPNSARALRFSKIVEAIRRMADLPPDHNFHIDAETAKKSQTILALLMNNFDLDVPKMFPQEGEALVLTWDSENIKRYLTVDKAELDLLDLNKRTRVRCAHELAFDGPEDLKDWIIKLGGLPLSNSDNNTPDAR